MTRMTKILNVIYGLTVLLFLFDILTHLDIKSQTLKSLVYFGLLLGTPLIFIWNAFTIKITSRKIAWAIWPALILIIILVIGPMKVLSVSGAWRTQTVLYQNGHLRFKKVEFQMQDIGAFGYNKRTVVVNYLTPLFIVTSEVPTDIDKRVEWVKVDKEVNELGLKLP